MAPHAVEEVDQRDIQQLREWLAKQPHLPSGIPERFLSRLLHSCYGSVERTKTTTENYFTITTHAPELFANRVSFDQTYQNAMKVIYLMPCPERTKEGYFPLLIRFQDPDPTKFDFVNIIKYGLTGFSALQEREGCIPGYVAMFDFEGITMGHIMRITLGTLKKFITYIQDGLPTRLKGIYFINSNALVQQVVNLVKPLMKPELLAIFHVFKTDEMDKFYKKFVPKRVLPTEDGGEGGKRADLHAVLLKAVEDHAGFLRETEKLVVDESKRVGKAKNSSEVFGIEGSFKKLDLD